MGLTTGAGPFGERPQGRFDFDPPAHVRYIESTAKHVRAEKDGRTIADSRRVMLVWETGKQPRYAFPAEDVTVQGRPVPGLHNFVLLDWGDADAWFEEAEQVIVHVRDLYHRIDVLETTRHVRVSIDGVTLADAVPKMLFETGLPPRCYFDPTDVRLDLLTPSETETG